MTNHFIHVTHNKPLYQCTYDKPADPSLPWEIIAIMPPSQTISAKPSKTNHLPIPHMTNHLTQATHDKPFWLCHPWKTLSPYYTHEKKLDPWCPREKPMQLCHHQKFFHPFNPWQTISPILPWQITSPMLLMTISHVPFLLTMSPIPPGQTIPPMLPITNHFTHPIHDIPFISKEKRYFTHLMFLCRGVTFPALSFFGNGWDHVAIDSSVIRFKVARE